VFYIVVQVLVSQDKIGNFSIHSTRRANVVGFDHETAVNISIPIVSTGTAIPEIEIPERKSVLLIVHEAIYNDTANHSLLAEFQ
jgi:hypothetical protein